MVQKLYLFRKRLKGKDCIEFNNTESRVFRKKLLKFRQGAVDVPINADASIKAAFLSLPRSICWLMKYDAVNLQCNIKAYIVVC